MVVSVPQPKFELLSPADGGPEVGVPGSCPGGQRSTTQPPRRDGERIRKQIKLVGRDKGSLMGQNRKRKRTIKQQVMQITAAHHLPASVPKQQQPPSVMPSMMWDIPWGWGPGSVPSQLQQGHVRSWKVLGLTKALLCNC